MYPSKVFGTINTTGFSFKTGFGVQPNCVNIKLLKILRTLENSFVRRPVLEPWRRRRRKEKENLLQEAGDVVLAAGGPGKGVGVGRDVRRHQLCRLVSLSPAGVPYPVMVHSKAGRRKSHPQTHKGAESEPGPSPANHTPPA